jgi:hypothetical protein
MPEAREIAAGFFKAGDRVEYVAHRKKGAKWVGTVLGVEQMRAGFEIVWCKPDYEGDKIGCAPENLRATLTKDQPDGR